MTSYDKKLKKSYAGEDIAGIFQEEDTEKGKSFRKQKSKNSELLANFRAKMSEIRSTDDGISFDSKEDFTKSFNSGNKTNFENKNQNSRNNVSHTKRKFSIKRPFFSKNKPKNQQRRNQTDSRRNTRN